MNGREPKPIDEPALRREVREGLHTAQLLESLAPYFQAAESIALQELGQVKPGDASGLRHLACRLQGIRDGHALMRKIINRGNVARKRIDVYHRAVEAWERMTRRAA